LPFHAAEQFSREWISDSAEYPARGATFRCRPFFAEQHPARGYKLRSARYSRPSDRLPFSWFFFWVRRQSLAASYADKRRIEKNWSGL